jgi:hypothetical protein
LRTDGRRGRERLTGWVLGRLEENISDSALRMPGPAAAEAEQHSAHHTSRLCLSQP